MPDADWVVYLLTSARGDCTYVGVTTDLERRLAQHNGERPGGAKSTRRGRPWRVQGVLSGFRDRASAQQEEHVLKRLKGDERLDYCTRKRR